RLKLEQTYDIEEAERDHDLEKYPRRPLRDVVAEAALAWDNRLGFNSKVYWSPYSGDFTSWDGGVSLNVQDWGTFSTGLNFRNKVNDYFTQRERLTMVTFRGAITGFDPLYATYYYNWSIDGSGEEESGLTLNYNHQCFIFTALVEKDEDETTIGFSITFAGFTIK
ncbi:MAG: LPS assembly protein LptD, partial [Desulfovibrio sp.]|nr:LPS assembly protein LptD [Desulfovibrio sp.]